MGITDRLRHAWNAFANETVKDPTNGFQNVASYGVRPGITRIRNASGSSMMAPIVNRIALDVTSLKLNHVQLDSNERFKSIIKSGLNECLTVNANKDQTGRAFLQDVVISMLDEGCVAIVPVDTTNDPTISGMFKINSLRTGKIVTWYPDAVKIKIYNDRVGKFEEVTLPKRTVAIIENPFYSVMNQHNSTLQRLIRKLDLLDFVDEQSGSGKLDMIVQLPYTIKSENQRIKADERRKNIEEQLTGSKYGIAYIDSTEHITQLNRPLENNLMAQIEYLTGQLYAHLNITQSVLDGTADEKTMLNYYARTIDPIIGAIVDEMKRKFLTKTARTQGQDIMYFRDPFRLVPAQQLAEISDKFTRNEIVSSNEIRQVIGFKPSEDPKADELRNSNIRNPEYDKGIYPSEVAEEGYEDEYYEE